MIKLIKNLFKWCDEEDKIQGENLDDISQEEWERGIALRNEEWTRIEREHWKHEQERLRN